MTHLPWGELRSILTLPPSQDTYDLIRALLLPLPKDLVRREALPYLEPILAQWPSCVDVPRIATLANKDGLHALANTLVLKRTDNRIGALADLRNIKGIYLADVTYPDDIIRFVSRRSLLSLDLGKAILTKGQAIQLAKVRPGITHLSLQPQDQEHLAILAASEGIKASVTHLIVKGHRGEVGSFLADANSALEHLHFETFNWCHLEKSLKGPRWDYIKSLALSMGALERVSSLPASLEALTLWGGFFDSERDSRLTEALLKIKRLTLRDDIFIHLFYDSISPILPQAPLEELTYEGHHWEHLKEHLLHLEGGAFPNLTKLTLLCLPKTQTLVFLRPAHTSMQAWVSQIRQDLDTRANVKEESHLENLS